MNSIEEDIKRIAKLITTKFNNDYSIDNVDKEAIEELLKAYKELKEIEESHRKENGELREKVKQLEEENKSKQKAYDDCYCEYKHYKQFDSIPKSKVKEKIGEIIIDLIKYNNSEEERDKEEIKEYFTKKAEKGE